MFKRLTFNRLLALVISTVLSSEPAVASLSKSNVWAERREAVQQMASLPQSFLLPNPSAVTPKHDLPEFTLSQPLSKTNLKEKLSPFGRIQRLTPVSKDQAAIIHIQDIHQNLEAQKNISDAISALIDADEVDLIALEGAFEDFNLTWFQTFPAPEVLPSAAEFLLTNNNISGPIHALIKRGKNIPIVTGVDDKKLYDENVQAYLDSEKYKSNTKESLRKSQINLLERKRSLFNQSLLEFDEVCTR